MGANRSVLLSDAIEEFMRDRRSMDLSRGTLKQDEVTLRRFLGVNGNVWVHSLDTSHVTRFFEDLVRTKTSTSMRNDYHRLSTFFAWARSTGRMANDRDPLRGRRKPKIIKRERSRVDISKFPALLDAAGQRDPRDRAALALLLYTLCRDAELTTLRIGDVDLDAGYIHVRIHKTYEEDRIPICAELDEELRAWLRIYTESVGGLSKEFFVLPARQTGPVFDNGMIVDAVLVGYVPDKATQRLSKIVNPALEKIDFATRDERGKPLMEGAHTIRRSGARALFDQLVANGYDRALRIVQSLLHHSSVTTTEKYIGVTADRRSRDEIIRGQRLYDLGNVVQLRQAEEA